MDDEQLLFWATQGKSVKTIRVKVEKNAVPYDGSLTLAENIARFKQASEAAKSGKNR